MRDWWLGIVTYDYWGCGKPVTEPRAVRSQSGGVVAKQWTVAFNHQGGARPVELVHRLVGGVNQKPASSLELQQRSCSTGSIASLQLCRRFDAILADTK